MERPTSLEQFGVYRALRWIYDNYVRDRLPRKVGVYNGVPVRDRALLDVTDEQPDYEGALVAGIRRQVMTDDNVVVVGGGRGVSSVSAAMATGSRGEVNCFEGGKKQYERLMETLKLNCVENWTSAHHAIVGSDVDVYGKTGDAEVIEPADMPDCDVLVLDCEGAEYEILQDIRQRPGTIVVETHGFLGTPESDVRHVLSDIGYEVVKRRPEYENRGVIVLTAKLAE